MQDSIGAFLTSTIDDMKTVNMGYNTDDIRPAVAQAVAGFDKKPVATTSIIKNRIPKMVLMVVIRE